MKTIIFEYEYLPTIEEVHKKIKECEGSHSQQVCFSTFHDKLTQICDKFGINNGRDQAIIKFEDLKSHPKKEEVGK